VGCGQETVSSNQQRDVAQCKMRWGKGEYQGECKNGRPEGYGIQRYPSGEYYKGAFKNGLRHGEGIQYLPDGTEIVADWVNGRPK
jgi:antitoxin component YwqK of YwqJK toxin-antitoxin module